jgi:hypothetical protein
MRLDKAIEKAMKGARSLRQAQINLFRLFDAPIKLFDNEHECIVRSYIVQSHSRRLPRRRKLRLLQGGRR